MSRVVKRRFALKVVILDMRKKLELLIKILIYATFFVPLIVIPSSFIFPFIVPKVVVFRSIMEVMIGAYILLLIINWKEYKPTMTPLTMAVLLFYVVSFGVSTFVGIDPYHSFWDNHERMLGFFTIMHYVAYYIIVSKILHTWTSWKWALRFFLFAGTAVMFIALLQVGSPYMLMNQGSDRVASTLGNPIYVGGYAMFLLFTGMLLIMKDKNRIWKYVYGFLMVFSFLGVFYSGTRGAMLALAAAVSAVMVIYIVALKGYKKTRITLAALLVLGVAVFGILYANRQSESVQRIPAIGRALNTSLAVIMESPRWIAWEISYYSFLERPFFGWGPNNFFYAFNMHYNPRSLDFNYGETWFDNAHNIVMNTIAVQGGVGIITYVGVFVVGFIVLVGAYRKQKIDIHLLTLGGGFLIAHFVGNITVFENITSYLYFMFWLAMINQMVQSKTDEPTTQTQNTQDDKKISWGPVITAGVLVLLCIYIFNIRPAKANMQTLDTIKMFSNDPVIGYEKMKIAFAMNSPHIDDIRSDACRVATQVVYNYGQQLDKELMKGITNTCRDEMLKNSLLHPFEVRTYMTLSQISQVKAYLDNDPAMIYESIQYSKKALEVSPKRQQIMYSLAMIYTQTQLYDEAIKLIEQAITDNPKVGESYWRLAYIYLLSGDNAKAMEMLNLGESNNALFTDNDKATIQQLFAVQTSTATTTE